MSEKARSFAGQLVLWSCAGVGFNLAQRVLDHFIDAAIASHPWLSFLASP
jgi:hypothetical protein